MLDQRAVEAERKLLLKVKQTNKQTKQFAIYEITSSKEMDVKVVKKQINNNKKK